MMPTGADARPEQFWLDVDRPIQTAPRRERSKLRTNGHDTAADRQVEMLLEASTPEPELVPPSISVLVSKPELDRPPEPPASSLPPFGSWLLDQGSQRGFLGELAKAAKLDRLFPRGGNADEVRARFSRVGADGDAFEALDDAECEYERQIA